MTATTIYHLDTREIDRCKDIRLACLADAPYAFGSTFEFESAQPDEWWQQRLTDGHWIVANRDGVDVAVAMLMFQGLPDSFEALPETPFGEQGDYPWIRAVWIRPEHRGQGLVDTLLDHLADVAAQTGQNTIVLGVRQGNDRAIKAYRRIGFAAVGRFWPSQSAVAEPNFLMARALLSS